MRSWVIVDNATGKAVFETFEKATADRVRNDHEDTHTVVPILEWLTGLNKQHNKRYTPKVSNNVRIRTKYDRRMDE